MDLKVIWSDGALADLRRIVGFIALDNPEAARRVGHRLVEATDLLRRFPESGRVYPVMNREDVRQLTVAPYRIVYHLRAGDGVVTILVVWHGARQLPDGIVLHSRGL